jgi:xanthine/CO dehydrogenase XdhC/CoxF family maturation factor
MDATADQDTSMLVVGGGEVARALAGFADVLGWACQVTEELDEAREAIPGSDLVVVLSHHDGVDAPAIAAALEAGPTYLGAMGSRRTQARRQEWLLEHGVTEADLAAVHGPAGLDIGANAPAEIAVSILAEAVSVLRGVSGGSISDREGPIHPTMEPGTAECPAAPAGTGRPDA